ncbi:demethoxyubiquinone hydroxylase family protein [Thermohalobacter berrensis]|uniref:Ubiquinone biosynthesis protein COQ7 n=1 Tax=Thermohalobacter berrensis TaxID=99594 RepID=A0A419TAB7_9FIRM|nr:demethoxyubiquinone hydroxylase family protein [Thermohalobacter berrensis]RKD34420.1 ubiquinone biosynthesis protein COQ7 [Thermohalobacter berrensis]
MPQMPNPFGMKIPKKITKEELIQAIRQDIVGELEAIFLYDAHAQATDDPRAKKILEDIRDEEREHVGELMTLLNILDPREAELFANGKEEVKEMMEELNIEMPKKEIDLSDKEPKTVGSLINK